MPTTAIESLARGLDWAYRSDPFHALRHNVESVRPDEWDVRPAEWTVEEFGSEPELSICDLTLHVAGAKYMYADRAFGDAALEWSDITPPSREMAAVLEWLDEGHRRLSTALAVLSDDGELAAKRPSPARQWQATREQLLRVVINHDLYHAGEINRQRALMRGASGWARG